MDLIRKVTEYTKDSSCRVLFFDADQKILFEDELELKNGSISVQRRILFSWQRWWFLWRLWRLCLLAG